MMNKKIIILSNNEVNVLHLICDNTHFECNTNFFENLDEIGKKILQLNVIHVKNLILKKKLQSEKIKIKLSEVECLSLFYFLVHLKINSDDHYYYIVINTILDKLYQEICKLN